MSKYDSLRDASFRGFAFAIPSDTVTQNMRIHTHKYPGKDEPYHEYLGKDVRVFSVDAVVNGEEFVDRATEFEMLLERNSPGILIHPYYGEIEVVVLGYSRTHVYSEVGLVSFSVTFEKYGAPQYPAAGTDTSAGLLVASSAAYDSLQSDFNENFVISGMPDFVSGDALTRLTSFNDSLNELLSITNTQQEWALDDLSDVPTKSINMFKAITDTAAPVNDALISLRSNVSRSVLSPLRIVQLLLGGTDTNLSDAISPITATQSVRVKNAQSLELLMHAGAITAAAATERFAQYESQEQAKEYKNSFVQKISDLSLKLADAGWDESWKSINTVSAAITRDINQRIGRLPYTLSIQPKSVRSSLAIANHLYGDNPNVIVDQAADMVTRNKIRNPGFVPASKMEVLIDAA